VARSAPSDDDNSFATTQGGALAATSCARDEWSGIAALRAGAEANAVSCGILAIVDTELGPLSASTGDEVVVRLAGVPAGFTAESVVVWRISDIETAWLLAHPDRLYRPRAERSPGRERQGQ
jgi:hypothetical protein